MTLEERLNNWALAQSGGFGHADSTIANIYFPSVGGRSVESTVNLVDAQLVEIAWRKLLPLDKKILQMLYIWHAHPAFICRKLGLKPRPTTVFDLALAHAKRSIEAALKDVRPRRVDMQTVIDRLKEKNLAEQKTVNYTSIHNLNPVSTE
ncbi:hypothetical protein [Caballeronia sp. KNU42]